MAPTDYMDPERSRVARELEASAQMHGAYLELLTEQGFSREEAMVLVRDHHALYTWTAIAPEPSEPPSWLGPNPLSNASPTSTGGDLVPLRPRSSDE